MIDAREAGGAFVMPSPGEVGAFSCTKCGGTALTLVPAPTGKMVVRLVCTRCWNYLDFAVVMEEADARTE